jgi:hypothetical protein
VQKLFSVFPTGGPGIALLLLRISVAAMLLIVASRGGTTASPLLCLGAIVLSAALCLGLLTPIAAALCCAIDLISLFGIAGADVRIVTLSALNAAALALIGPGAYSIDAHLFGRRVVHLPAGSGRHGT